MTERDNPEQPHSLEDLTGWTLDRLAGEKKDIPAAEWQARLDLARQALERGDNHAVWLFVRNEADESSLRVRQAERLTGKSMVGSQIEVKMIFLSNLSNLLMEDNRGMVSDPKELDELYLMKKQEQIF